MNRLTPRDLNRFIVLLNRGRGRYMHRRLQQYGLYGPMYSILLHLERCPGSSQDSLSEYFLLDKSTVARLARRLEELELISRSVTQHDRRQYQLLLTDAGRSLLAVIHDHLNTWSDAMLTGLSEEEQQTVGRLLQRMTENVSDIAPV